MTRRLLAVAAEAHVSSLVYLVVLCAILVVMPFTLAIDIIGTVRMRLRTREALATRRTTCPRGHPVDLAKGAFACPSCGLVHEGHAFAPCPHCGAVAAAISCPCGLPVRNPIWTPDGTS